MTKIDSIYNKDGFFNIEGWFNLIGIDYKKDSHVLILTSPRNNGKTFSCWNFIMKMWKETNYEWKIGIARTNDLRMKESIASFKSAYSKEFEVVGGFIYKIVRNEDGKIVDGSRKMCGRFINIENEHNYRSPVDLGFDGFHFLFWDEFNETKQTSLDLFTKWTMLLSTVERFNKPFIHLVLGNKINANNDLFIRLNLNTSRRDLRKDHIQHVSSRITYVDVGFDTYKNIENNLSLVNEVASFDDKANKLFNEGGFLEGTFYNVINHQNFTFKEVKYCFTLGQNVVEFGSFLNLDYSEDKLYFINEIKAPLDNVPIIALDVVGYSKNGMSLENEDLKELSNHIFNLIQKRSLYFSSFFIMDEFEKWVFRNTNLFGK